jgi:hypothetical protein
MVSFDLIAATVILTAVLLIVFGWAGVFQGRAHLAATPSTTDGQRGRLMLSLMLGIYFLGVTDVFVITQQYNLAFVNLVAGIAIASVQYFSGRSRARDRAEDADDNTGPGTSGR